MPLDILPTTLITIVIVITVLIIYYILKTLLNKYYQSIKNRTVVFIFALFFIIIIGAANSILFLWGYDPVDYFRSIGVDATTFLEEHVPRLIATAIITFVSLLILKIVTISLKRVGRGPSPNQRRKQTIAKISMSISKYIVGIITILIVLSVWGLNVGPALAGLGIMGIVIGLGAQKFINDLISGFFILFEHHFDVGDWVDINGFMGEVIDIGLKTTKVRNFKGEIRIFNNGSIDPVSNFSISTALAVVDFDIAYEEDIEETTKILTDNLPVAKEEISALLETPRVLGVVNLAESGVTLRVVAMTQSMTQWQSERDLRRIIKRILNQNGIEIPFPQVTVHQAKPKQSK